MSVRPYIHGIRSNSRKQRNYSNIKNKIAVKSCNKKIGRSKMNSVLKRKMCQLLNDVKKKWHNEIVYMEAMEF